MEISEYIRLQIGEAAALEQLAEECTELAQACLKKARILRKENPTPTTIEEADRAIKEEKQDVLNCIMVHGTEDINRLKLKRWCRRILENK